MFGNDVVAGCIVKEKMFRDDIDVSSGLVKMDKPSGRIVMVNVDHEARVRIEPEIREPVR